MSNVHAPISTTIKLRLPVETLDFLNAWAAARGIPRSRAIRLLVNRGFAHVGRDAEVPNDTSSNCQ
jgi:hypothetical protein